MDNPKRYLLGVDLAKSLDYTSFSVVEMEIQEDPLYHLMVLDRIQGIDYVKITDMILAAIQKLSELQAADGPHLCMDASGLGAPIKDFLMKSGTFEGNSPCRLYPVVFTGGEKARYDMETGNYNISKALIIGNFKNLMDRRRFDYLPGLETWSLLMSEIENFRYTLTDAGHISYNAKNGTHDDLICALAIPLIIAEWQLPHYVIEFDENWNPGEAPSMGVYDGPY